MTETRYKIQEKIDVFWVPAGFAPIAFIDCEEAKQRMRGLKHHRPTRLVKVETTTTVVDIEEIEP